MAVITSGKTFANGEQLSASKLNQVITSATFNQSDAVDGSTITLIGGAMAVVDGGITKAKLATEALELAYPVGSIYMNATVATNPGTLLGFGTWATFGAGKVPVGIDASDTDFDTAEETGGAKTHTLTLDEMPAHDHVPNRNTYGTNNLLLRRNANGANTTDATDTSVGEPDIGGSNLDFPEIEGNGDAHANLQPYIVVYMWKRTA